MTLSLIALAIQGQVAYIDEMEIGDSAYQSRLADPKESAFATELLWYLDIYL